MSYTVHILQLIYIPLTLMLVNYTRWQEIVFVVPNLYDREKYIETEILAKKNEKILGFFNFYLFFFYFYF
jgi:hypothetical protein